MGPSGVGKTSIMEVIALRRRALPRRRGLPRPELCARDPLGGAQSSDTLSWVEQYPQHSFLDNLTVVEETLATR